MLIYNISYLFSLVHAVSLNLGCQGTIQLQPPDRATLSLKDKCCSIWEHVILLATYLYIFLNLCRIGDKMITFFLRDCAIYVPIGFNYYQVTGALNLWLSKMLSVLIIVLCILCAEFACHLSIFFCAWVAVISLLSFQCSWWGLGLPFFFFEGVVHWLLKHVINVKVCHRNRGITHYMET